MNIINEGICVHAITACDQKGKLLARIVFYLTLLQ